MLALKDTLVSFLLPPGTFITFLLIFGSWFLIQKKKWIGISHLLIAGILWMLSTSPMSNALLRSLESDFDNDKKQVGDVIILLSESIHPHVPGILGPGAPSSTMLSRIFAAAMLQRYKNIPVIISGSHQENTYTGSQQNSDSSIAKRYLTELGVPAEQISLENKSKNTFENAKFSQEICLRYDFKNPIVVTSAYHLKRSILSFRKIGMRVSPFPAHFLSWENRIYTWRSILPGHDNLRKSSIAIKEHLGLLFYTVFY